jgi:UDP-glucuronate 4-epimerase
MAALEHCEVYSIYNLGESQTIELYRMIALIEASLGRKANIKRMPLQPGDVPITYADINRAQKELNYKPQVCIEEGIGKFVDWFKSFIHEKG